MRPQPDREISPDRLTEIPTDELSFLAGQFHVLTKQMYEELCIRRTAERTTLQAERPAAREQRGHIMTTQSLKWDSRCADCRGMLPADSTGYQVHERLVCAECAADADWMAAAL